MKLIENIMGTLLINKTNLINKMIHELSTLNPYVAITLIIAVAAIICVAVYNLFKLLRGL